MTAKICKYNSITFFWQIIRNDYRSNILNIY